MTEKEKAELKERIAVLERKVQQLMDDLQSKLDDRNEAALSKAGLRR